MFLLAAQPATAYDVVTTTLPDQATALATCQTDGAQYPPHDYFGVPNEPCTQLFNVVGERNARYEFCTLYFPSMDQTQSVLCDSSAETKYEYTFAIPYEEHKNAEGSYPSNSNTHPACLEDYSAALGFPAASCRYDNVGVGYAWSSCRLFNSPSQTTSHVADNCTNLHNNNVHITSCEEHYYDTQTCEWGAFANLGGYSQCYPQERNAGEICEARPTGNPVNPAAGNKYQREVDVPAGLGVPGIVRHYNSRVSLTPPSASPIGAQWTLGYDRRVVSTDAQGGGTLILFRPDGQVELFDAQGGGVYQATGDNPAALSATLDGGGLVTTWRYIGDDNRVEDYDGDGRLIAITDLTGNVQALSYDTNGRLDRVDANTGESLQFGYDASDRVSTITDSAGRTWTYHYDTDGNLSSVDNPDGTTKQYHYNEQSHTANTDLPHALTGITDERGNRYATFAYQADGRAVATYHAGNAERVDIDYNDTNGTRTVTNSLGQASSYSTAVQLGVALVTGIDGPGCTSCGGSDTDYTYDPATNDLLEKTANGITTKYGNYDAKGQKGCVTEGIDASDSSTGACGFDPAVSPDARRTDYTYDSRFHGKVTTVTEASVY